MRKVIKTLAAAAVALTSFSAVPAAAGNRNLERFAIGAGTILLLNGLSNGGHAEVRHDRHAKKKYNRHHYKHHNRKHVRKHRRALPRKCLISVRKNHRWVEAYSSRCLRRHGY